MARTVVPVVRLVLVFAVVPVNAGVDTYDCIHWGYSQQAPAPAPAAATAVAAAAAEAAAAVATAAIDESPRGESVLDEFPCDEFPPDKK